MGNEYELDKHVIHSCWLSIEATKAVMKTNEFVNYDRLPIANWLLLLLLAVGRWPMPDVWKFHWIIDLFYETANEMF